MNPVTIIGSGFAAYQLVKTLRRMDQQVPIRVITADRGHDYNKPDLSHVVSRQQTSQQLISTAAEIFASEQNIELCTEHRVEDIDLDKKAVFANEQRFDYSNLVLATGAMPFIPPIQGLRESGPITLNSLKEFDAFSERLTKANSILVIGGGLIGVEISMDLALANKQVTVIEAGQRLMGNQLPELVALKLEQSFDQLNIDTRSGETVTKVSPSESGYQVKLGNGEQLNVDEVLVCAGLVPNTTLAKHTGLAVNRGICVDESMQTSENNIYALGDCAEFGGQVRAYLQPTVVSASALAKTLLGELTAVVLPKMMVKVKTPKYPIQIAGTTSDSQVHRWNLDIQSDGIVAKAYNKQEVMIGFVATQDKTKQAFPLLRELSA
ncbi:nitric oxide reductase FlRd-NAD(+) reductase [Vibrio inusitatus NBRC 102082]|uniref:Nitric oxide reductase FlRd-NAD(+) reductase n=1 Tax=Vibrio inusitatus NBRC 102082 TaxID=1219070 RepID=A0A4Y3HR98_9VIBR|nr:NADH:flavorubredoxin reductase NorW [Vibrio inusitatus]GEA49673.1 nitric oxide reductase FlRd-NAD(+) reductase [Vibrio inusitatus NBRC 102082]